MKTDRFCTLPSGIRLCFRDAGQGEPLLLVIGLGLQLIHWPEALIDDLVRRGFRVITLDNRDIGLSSRTQAPIPGNMELLRRTMPAGGYTLSDLAADAVGLLDHLGVERAHLAGMSMGGMIVQNIAALHPQRVHSLTSIFSTTGARRVGQPGLRMMFRLMRRPPRGREGYIARFVDDMRFIGGRGYPIDAAQVGSLAAAAWDRNGPDLTRGVARQLGAIIASGDRTGLVSSISAPTLVIHGDRDPLVHPSGGKATLRAIRGARLVTIPGMGHDLHPALCPRLATLIEAHASAHPGRP